ncbi:hypothetical protein [Falsirhodobacter halotolerans]|uniref:hypothetical protein n=1 Tax=Falsirhodobacter halotolerans TaxID=1146892 RepID=UPI001FD48128|nr:hypothetical protein [Falsirhodobacter halotolerans]MCJ8140129.1 hypothetical protein [Falsirhodobacter halotolerans]
MTAFTHTGFPLRGQDGAAFTHTAVSRSFAALIVAIRAHVEAERDLEHAGSWDLACDAWLRDAEAARAAVLTSVADFRALPVDRPEDRVLRHAAGLIGALVDCDSPEAFGHYRARIVACAGRFAPDAGPLARRLSRMMDVLLDVMTAMAALPDYDDMIDAVSVDPVTDSMDEDDTGPFEVPADILDPPFAREMPVASPGVGPL